MIKQKGSSVQVPLYRDVTFIQLDERKKQMQARREVLSLKQKLRENSIKDMNEAKQKGVKKALKLFETKNGGALRRNKQLMDDMKSARENFAYRSHANVTSHSQKHLDQAR